MLFCDYMKSFNKGFKDYRDLAVSKAQKGEFDKELIDYKTYSFIEKDFQQEIEDYLNSIIDKLTKDDSSFDSFRKLPRKFFSYLSYSYHGDEDMDELVLGKYILNADENAFENEVEKTILQIVRTYMENEKEQFMSFEDYSYVVLSELIYLGFKNNHNKENVDFNTFAIEAGYFATPLQLRQKIGCCPTWE